MRIYWNNLGWMGMLLSVLVACKKEDPPMPSAPDLLIEYARLGSESILHGSAVTPDGDLIGSYDLHIWNRENDND